MDVKKAMTLNPTFCKPETTLREIAKTMKSFAASHGEPKARASSPW